MKTLSIISLLFITITFSGCFLKKKDDPYYGLNENIQNIVPLYIIDSLENKGFIINRGSNPPILNYAIKVSPNVLVVPYGPDDDTEIGYKFSNDYYNFHDQSEDGLISFEYDSGASIGSGKGSFISGEGNDFTIFAEVKNIASGLNYTRLDVISGRYSETGIINFEKAFVITYKDEPPQHGQIIPLNSGRVTKDEDGFSEVIDYFDNLRVSGNAIRSTKPDASQK